MKTLQKEQEFSIPVYTKIIGKWNKHEYTIVRAIGSGANGQVYLALNEKEKVALKISDDETSITSEVNILKKLVSSDNEHLKSMLREVDDWYFNGKNLFFYTMTYIEGEDFLPFIQKNGQEWLQILTIQLLNQLSVLHQYGYIFGDVKPENMKVTNHPPSVRLLDVGGITQIGRSVKQFTEFFDRGYWGLGTRKADIKYDLFSIAMVIINTSYPNKFNKRNESLIQMVRNSESLKPFVRVIEAALNGKYESAEEMKRDLLTVRFQRDKARKATKTTQNTAPKQSSTNHINNKMNSKKRKKKHSKLYSAIETILILTFLMIAYSFYIMAK